MLYLNIAHIKPVSHFSSTYFLFETDAECINTQNILKSEFKILNAYTHLRRNKDLKTVWLHNYVARCGVNICKLVHRAFPLPHKMSPTSILRNAECDENDTFPTLR